jgi:hypothetical protein
MLICVYAKSNRIDPVIEIDLLLEFSRKEKWAIEIKRTAPKLGKCFHIACEGIM